MILFLIVAYVAVSLILGLAVSLAGGDLPPATSTRRPDVEGLTSAEFQLECWKLDNPEKLP